MSKLELIAAKSDSLDRNKWLPFKVHALDTAGIMENLFNLWLSCATREYLISELNVSLDREQGEEIACNFCRLLALLHDIGKLTVAFQTKIRRCIDNYANDLVDIGIDIFNYKGRASDSPHDLAGQAILRQYGFNMEILCIIGSHHGKLKTKTEIDNQLAVYNYNYFGDKKSNEELWKTLWQEWISYALAETDFCQISDLPTPNIKVQMILSGLLIMSDWIASNQEYFPYVEYRQIILEDEYEERILKAWDSLSLPECWYANNVDEDIFFREFGFAPNSVQQEMLKIAEDNIGAGIYILEAPMGVGKTEASLGAAEIIASKLGCNGIYFGLPTQATANGIFSRIYDWAEKSDESQHSINLVHKMRNLNDEYKSLFHGTANEIDIDNNDSNIFVHEWFEGKKQALLADFVVATIDQFLLASLKQRHVMLRHLGLAGKVVIIDECHAYDAYMNIYLDNTLCWMGAYHVPVIVLSATLPPKRRRELLKAYLGYNFKDDLDFVTESIAYPLLTWSERNGDTQKVYQKEIVYEKESTHILVTKITDDEIVTQLDSKLADGGCAAVIVNSVKYAQKLAKQIKEQLTDKEIICFHSKFIATDRAEIEKEILRRVGKNSNEKIRNGLIIVATQVLEQSLDVDVDYMITELCPMDLLLQRCGRLHRHKRYRSAKLQTPELAIIDLEGKENDSVYNSWLLKKTGENLPKELVLPECIPDLVGKVYAEAENEEKDTLAWKQYDEVIQNKKTKANQYCIKSKNLFKKRNNWLSDVLENIVSDKDDKQNDIRAVAAVRDADETIEVLALRHIDKQYYLMSNQCLFNPVLALSNEEAEMIAKERLQLPRYFSKYCFEQTIAELSAIPQNWRDNKWVAGELLLLFDENDEADLCGKRLHYSCEYGLEMVEVLEK